MVQNSINSEVASINLDNLRNSGYRIDWMNQSNNHDLHLPTVTENSLYTLDSNDYLSKYDLMSGEWIWTSPIGNQVFELRSINESKHNGMVYIVSDGAVYVIESDSGNYPSSSRTTNSSETTAKKLYPLKLVANTPAIYNDKYLIYGSTSGDVIWFNPEIGYSSNRYRIGSSVDVEPTFAEGSTSIDGRKKSAIITPSKNGTIIAINSRTLKQFWTLKLIDAIEAPVTYSSETSKTSTTPVPRTSVFIAGTDQYLRSVDFFSGKPRWKVLTTSKLEDSPFVLEDNVYQRIPDIGLGSYIAFPHEINAKENWLASDVSGNVITTTPDNRLVCWDENARILQIVEPRTGGVVSNVSMSSTKQLITDNKTNGSLYLITDNDMILRIVPRQ